MKIIKNLLIILFIICTPVVSNADGGFVTPDLTDQLQEPGQRAFIMKQDDVETIILQVKTDGKANEIGWIIPLPAYPEVQEYTPEFFEELITLTKIEHDETASYMGDFGGGGGEIIIETEVVGYYEVNKIRANDEVTLFDWLKEHDYQVPDRALDLLREYIGNDFCFIAIRIIPEKINDRVGKYTFHRWLAPIKITFESDCYFYPMKISSINPGSTDLTLWVLEDYRMKFEGAFEQWGDFVDYYELKTSTDFYDNLRKVIPKDKKYFISRLHRKWEDNSLIESDIIITEGSADKANTD